MCPYFEAVATVASFMSVPNSQTSVAWCVHPAQSFFGTVVEVFLVRSGCVSTVASETNSQLSATVHLAWALQALYRHERLVAGAVGHLSSV